MIAACRYAPDASRFAYLEAGGRPEPLSADTLELFSLQWHLSEVSEAVVRRLAPALR